MENQPAADRRVVRTRKLLHEALVELMAEKDYESITVQHIIDRAGVGRSTFYAHFYGKEELLQEGFEQLQRSLSRLGDNVREDGRFSFSLAMLRHAQEHHRLYQAIAGKQISTIVLRQISDRIATLVGEELAAMIEGDRQRKFALPIPIVQQYVSGSFISLLIWWLDHDMPYTAEEMDRMFHEATLPGIESARRKSVENTEKSF